MLGETGGGGSFTTGLQADRARKPTANTRQQRQGPDPVKHTAGFHLPIISGMNGTFNDPRT